MTKEDFLEIVASCVASLPHKVEWFEGAQKIVEVQDTFILPLNVIEVWGGIRVMFDPCKEIADKYGCRFFKANDGSFVFKH
jgi:hypothetical protein